MSQATEPKTMTSCERLDLLLELVKAETDLANDRHEKQTYWRWRYEADRAEQLKVIRGMLWMMRADDIEAEPHNRKAGRR